jgi:hypothetical protein
MKLYAAYLWFAGRRYGAGRSGRGARRGTCGFGSARPVRRRCSRQGHCADPVRSPLGVEIATERQALQVRSAYQAAQASEMANSVYQLPANATLDADYIQTFGAPEVFGDVPLVVLSHSIDSPARAYAPLHNFADHRLHEQTAALSPHGVHRVVPESNRNSGVEQPQAIDRRDRGRPARGWKLGVHHQTCVARRILAGGSCRSEADLCKQSGDGRSLTSTFAVPACTRDGPTLERTSALEPATPAPGHRRRKAASWQTGHRRPPWEIREWTARLSPVPAPSGALKAGPSDRCPACKAD